jgi:hypothetical protein
MRFTPIALLFSGFALIAVTCGAAHDDERRGRGRGGRVTFYQDADFRGGSMTLEAGDEIDNLSMERFSNGGGVNDRISSIRIEGPVEVTVYRDSRYRGASQRFSRDVSNLAHDGGEWNDIISSIRTEIRRPGEARAERAEIDGAIARVFRDTLDRKPDQSEQRMYRARMIDENWSEKDVRAELTKTEEYRRVVERVVSKAYRDLLGRESDSGGLRNYSRLMLQENWTEERVRHSIRESEEYRDRRRGGPGR